MERLSGEVGKIWWPGKQWNVNYLNGWAFKQMWKWKEKYIFLLLSIHVFPPFIIITTIFVIYIFALVIVIVIAVIIINLVSPLRETVQVVSVDTSQKKYRCSPVEMFMFP